MAGSKNGTTVPAAYPPPVQSPDEFIKRGLDGEDEIIEVGVLVVGGDGRVGMRQPDPPAPGRRHGAGG